MKKNFTVSSNQEMTDLATRMCNAEITKPLLIEVSVKKKNRSLAQNKLFHLHMSEIAKHYGETQGEFYPAAVWKKYYKDKFLPEITSEIKGKLVTTTKDTSDLKMDEFASLIESVIQDAAQELNCQVTLPQDMYAEAMGYGKKK